jgi:hypothetical protein
MVITYTEYKELSYKEVPPSVAQDNLGPHTPAAQLPATPTSDTRLIWEKRNGTYYVMLAEADILMWL